MEGYTRDGYPFEVEDFKDSDIPVISEIHPPLWIVEETVYFKSGRVLTQIRSILTDKKYLEYEIELIKNIARHAKDISKIKVSISETRANHFFGGQMYAGLAMSQEFQEKIEKWWRCNWCGGDFISQEEFDLHMNLRHKTWKEVLSEHPDKSYSDFFQLKEHKRYVEIDQSQSEIRKLSNLEDRQRKKSSSKPVLDGKEGK